MRRIVVLPFVVSVLSGLLLAKSVSFRCDLGAAVGQALGSLLLVSLFVERLIEVVVSIWREPEQEKHDTQVNALADPAGKALVGKEDEFTKAQKERETYKGKTGVFASAVGLIIGVLVATAGFRALEPLLNSISLNDLVDWQRKLLIGVDVLLTGAVLSGGSDSVHKIFNAYNAFMDAVKRQADSKGKTQ